MKKYLIAFGCVLFCCVLLIVFAVPDRIQYAIYGMAGYNVNRYNIVKTPLPAVTVDLDMSTYDKQPVTAYCEDGLEVVIESLTYEGNAYTVKIISKGTSSFESGRIIEIDANVIDQYIETDAGKLVFALLGEDPLVDEKAEYTYVIYPFEDSFDLEKLSTIRFKLKLDHMSLVTYERI